MKLLLAIAAVALTLQAQTALRLERRIPLGNIEGRIDHLAIDQQGERLFVAALGNNTVEAVDLRAGKNVHSIPGLSEPQGLFYFADRNQLFVANGGDGTVRAFDAASFALRHELRFGSDADNLRYEPARKRVWVGYGDGALAAIDAESARRLGEVKVGAHPESFQLETKGARIFVNVPDAHEIAVVDREKLALLAKWRVTDAAANFPMALDEPDHLLFSGCRKPARLLVFDTRAGRQVASAPICGDTDDLFWDGRRKRLYVACGEGFIDVIAQRGPAEYERLERIATVPGARTALFSPDLDRLYLAVRRHSGSGAEIRVYAPPAP